MKAQSSRIALVLSFLACTCLSLVAFAQDKTPPEAYSGVATGTGGSVAQLVKYEGTDALRRALEKEDKGRINAVGSTCAQIAVARKRQHGHDTIITIVTARSRSFVELRNSGRSTDYPFGFLQVKLNAKGESTGQIMGAAKIRFDKKKGQYEIESYGNQYVKATNVRPRS